MYQPRTYRHWIKDTDLVSFEVVVKETDLQIRAQRDLKAETLDLIIKHRTPLEEYIQSHPLFISSLEPVPVERDAPDIVKNMAQATRIAGVGPMAAVAGAIAEAVGKDLLTYTPEVIVENGGDIFIKTSRTRLIGIYAGSSSLTGKLALKIAPETIPLGICTSSGTVGPSLSLGAADAAIVLSRSTALADAAATAIGNVVKGGGDIALAIERAQTIKGVIGVVIIKCEEIGLWGDIEILNVD
jgi:hypothetical protein